MAPGPAKSATIYVTKLAAAQRQLHTAIRMTLAGEDELAIHTVAAAAYRLLRDLKRKRGRSEFSDLFSRGFYAVAHGLATGKLAAVPDDVAESPQIAKLIEMIAGEIRRGTIRSATDVGKKLSMSGEAGYWQTFNAAANFLKHADHDAGELLSADKVNNAHVLLAACAAYLDLMARRTPEISAFAVYSLGHDPALTPAPGWTAAASERFAALSPAKKRRFCLALLRALKKDAKGKQPKP